MPQKIKEYAAKLDSKNRLTVRESRYEYFQITEFTDGTMVLKPRVLVSPDSISKRTLQMMDKSIKNFKDGKVSNEIELEKYLSLVSGQDEV